MGTHDDRKTLDVKLGDTARIDRRNTVLAQLEAALLADKLSLEEARATGTDPYDTGKPAKVAGAGVWNTKRPR